MFHMFITRHEVNYSPIKSDNPFFLSGIAKNNVNKTVRDAASKKLFGFAELGRSHKEKSTSVDERNHFRRDVGLETV
jgi:hypothetical protein